MSSPLTQGPRLVAIAGPSGSGKSHLAQQMAQILDDAATLVSQDDFYRDLAHLPIEAREQQDFDVPTTIDWATLLTTLGRLRESRAASIPRYDHATHTREPGYRIQGSKPIVIFEGLWLFHTRALGRLFDLTLYLDCPRSIRLQRRIQRDTASRDRSPESIETQFFGQVVPSEEKWVFPQKECAMKCLLSPVEPSTVDQIVRDLAPPGSNHTP